VLAAQSVRIGAARGEPGTVGDHDETHEQGRNPGDVWTIPTRPLLGTHFAAFPIELPLRCIAAGCEPGGTVLDPFTGTGTTGQAASLLDRKYVGIDLRGDYLELTLRSRLAQASLPPGGPIDQDPTRLHSRRMAILEGAAAGGHELRDGR
jgi:hypothetical protein